jgi:hypothetical protein
MQCKIYTKSSKVIFGMVVVGSHAFLPLAIRINNIKIIG